ncbi:MAG: addiction module protein [Gemmatimonadales bacterium]|nr:addiction module protein [Gemmatimonadales bacterium]MDZ4390582.1 addiction module protein [Gemmatimonadales bacterium]
MATPPIYDFSHLTPSERIELAEELWDSLDTAALPVSGRQVSELRRRRALLDQEPPGRPWQEVLDEIEQRGG